jgi:hypothetical protein
MAKTELKLDCEPFGPEAINLEENKRTLMPRILRQSAKAEDSVFGLSHHFLRHGELIITTCYQPMWFQFNKVATLALSGVDLLLMIVSHIIIAVMAGSFGNINILL